MNVEVVEGRKYEDARGTLRFCNDFDMAEVRRFYTIANDAALPRRGWIGHRRECKWFFPVKGLTRIHVAPMDSEGSVQVYELMVREPRVVKVPGGNWFLIEQDGNAEVMVFSNCRVGEFPNDDFRR